VVRPVTTPERGARSGFSIFIASRTATSWPSSTRSPLETARETTIAATPPTARAVRGPQASETHPINGAPIGVVPRRHIMYRLMTRPRISGAVVSCTV